MSGIQYINFATRYYYFTVKRVGLSDQLNTIPISPYTEELYNSYINDQWVHETNSGCIWKIIAIKALN